jgi:hypothetical protein
VKMPNGICTRLIRLLHKQSDETFLFITVPPITKVGGKTRDGIRFLARHQQHQPTFEYHTYPLFRFIPQAASLHVVALPIRKWASSRP